MIDMVGTWALDPLLLVIAVSIVYLILGMFLDPLGMILLTVPVFVPMFVALNLDLVWLGVLVVKYIGIGLLTRRSASTSMSCMVRRTIRSRCRPSSAAASGFSAARSSS